jgi:hypothetical protein
MALMEGWLALILEIMFGGREVLQMMRVEWRRNGNRNRRRCKEVMKVKRWMFPEVHLNKVQVSLASADLSV